MSKAKRVVVVSDFHCGHRVGLTHPKFRPKPIGAPTREDRELAETQAELWDFFAAEIEKLRPIDVLICNGDMIDGKGHRSGGTEQITQDRDRQCSMAAAAIEFCAPKKTFLTYGTGYHTGDDEDWEDIVAERVGAESIKSHAFIEVNGLVFDCKHHLGSSQVPHTRLTAVARERLWNLMWSEYNDHPKADVLIRSHVHYFGIAGGYRWIGFSTPALQGLGSKYGARRCSGVVDFGFMDFLVEDKKNWTFQPHIALLKTQRVKKLVA